jgi:hypothetical protein
MSLGNHGLSLSLSLLLFPQDYAIILTGSSPPHATRDMGRYWHNRQDFGHYPVAMTLAMGYHGYSYIAVM